MSEDNKIIDVHVAKDRLSATLTVVDYDAIDQVQEDDFWTLMKEKEMEERVLNTSWDSIFHTLKEKKQVEIAKGELPKNGKDGELKLIKSLQSSLEVEEKKSFRDVARIPTVEEGEKIAELVPPTEGVNGVDVYNQVIKASKGKPAKCRAGKNVQFESSENAYYAEVAGQLSHGDRILQVFPVYEVKGDVSLETGNLDFVGSITIHGNVPTGYTIHAKGDITVFGLVEGAHLEAGENITIKEGIAGMEKATIHAGANLHCGYINQADVHVGKDLVIQNSIMHSQCVAQENVFCENGNIIGGSISAGKKIVVNHVGNKANTKTELAFGINKKLRERAQALADEKNDLLDKKEKLKVLGQQLQQKQEQVGQLPTKERIMLLKQRNMWEQTESELENVKTELEDLQYMLGNLDGMSLEVKGVLNDHTELIFGKYKRVVNQEHQRVNVFLEENEIVIRPLS
ncbi:hypothetical protein J416_00664 [Gracilibacillus halophilus YIM-C55.5]|uniref:Flagellar Assembly Protein A N-terminal region domain-containing protein n=1 Tax=Gracilibacillus halophilus YIM-C55.5 TaxID=1308866 RepID=N4WQ05_9BACI|nr:FapA family protein [Gracilibacillus halophilus]ENH98212.1 hypothetical protein J416_00664 [Gracilibacillus halophilus YIM-C55.5]